MPTSTHNRLIYSATFMTLCLASCSVYAVRCNDDPLEITTTNIGTGSTMTGDGGLSLSGTIGQPAGTLANGETVIISSLLDDLTPPCPADFNQDGLSDFFDYLDFVDAFSSESTTADFNGDSVIDFFDYLDFVDAFSIGC